MAKYDQFFINVMMVEELGLQVPDPDDDTVKEGEWDREWTEEKEPAWSIDPTGVPLMAD